MTDTGTHRRRRSAAWFGAEGRSGMVYRSWMRNQGYSGEVFDGRPVIGIATTWSELAPCNSHLHRVAESVKRGVWQAGGFPLEFPAMALGETLMRPTAMLYRNLLAMEAEELMRANPLDGVVLLSGCDKTTPGLLMAASSVDLPAIMVTGGPMLNGKYRGGDVGSGTQVWRFEAELAAGRMTQEECDFAEGCMARSNGHCMTMGTASTMASMAEALGMQLPYSASWPAVDARRYETAQRAGRRIVAMVEEDLRPSQIMTRAAFENAIRVNAAIGGSTNAVIHLLAIAGRLGVPLTLDDFDALAREVPTLVDLQPSGRFLMEDFCYAGGLPVVMRELGALLHTDAATVSGRTVAENVAGAECWNREVIRPLDDPFQEAGTGTAVLRGNLAPNGAVIKQSAASRHLLRHRGRALVFDTPEDYLAVHADEDLPVDENTVLVIRGSGPRGYPGMPEVANVVLPPKLLRQGVEDMVRVCDGRMSGTGFGTVVLHVSPESAVGGPLALVRDGDWITLDVPARALTLEVGEEELERRRAAWEPPPPVAERGWSRLYTEHVLQADQGLDLDFLTGSSGHQVPRESH
ncbi:dihydroxy-acid dehydratase [Streptomyces hygroscopicus subsp. sporocinereus]|uniref:Dihydroxy-acid dehydratase n=1 Tax=Streptomyces hygroscopicus TaxID=1912 RepID=A0ABQ3TS38_STRHY|nr:IlvD/Edd family dehydratase [Streptomyces hygroscopicus]GHJ26154.1 dihydroxy-acid dehydratase [Streptomyces hygroscopicus]GLV72823.1 dihydroxy-acid dehydratase [Streptomyces hygroscopicus subsp. hygroscopicus]